MDGVSDCWVKGDVDEAEFCEQGAVFAIGMGLHTGGVAGHLLSLRIDDEVTGGRRAVLVPEMLLAIEMGSGREQAVVQFALRRRLLAQVSYEVATMEFEQESTAGDQGGVGLLQQGAGV